jgi:hypothetical protein
MNTSDPQFLYMVLVLPSLFGLTLVGDGLNKVVHDEQRGIISIVFGFMFIGIVLFAYFFVSSIMTKGI